MLLKEEEISPGTYVAYYNSSNILLSKYIYADQKLAVIFSKGHQYVYSNVLPYHYQRFKVAQSQGKALKEHIISKYLCSRVEVKLEPEVLDGVKKQIQELKKNP